MKFPFRSAAVVLAGLALSSGCVQIVPRAMPRDWPASVSATPARLSGDFTGTPRDLSRSAGVFFRADELHGSGRRTIVALRLVATETTLVARITCDDGRTRQRTVPIAWEGGAALATRRHSGREGGNAATYRDTWRLTTDAADGAVFEHTAFTTARLLVVPGLRYEREWWRLSRVPPREIAP